jgi:hypothetical protein
VPVSAFTVIARSRILEPFNVTARIPQATPGDKDWPPDLDKCQAFRRDAPVSSPQNRCHTRTILHLRRCRADDAVVPQRIDEDRDC